MSNSTPNYQFPEGGLYRLREIIKPQGPVPVRRSCWYAGIKTGRFPKPVRIGSRIVAWKKSDIDQLLISITKMEAENAA